MWLPNFTNKLAQKNKPKPLKRKFSKEIHSFPLVEQNSEPSWDYSEV